MGLDNGIRVKRNGYTNEIPALQRFTESWDKKHEYDFEFCYWRKCYGLRNDVIRTIGGSFVDQYRFDLTKDNIEDIIKLLKSYNSETWTDSIWDWDDEEYPYSEYIQQNIEDLQSLRELMDKYNLEVYFYDSY